MWRQGEVRKGGIMFVLGPALPLLTAAFLSSPCGSCTTSPSEGGMSDGKVMLCILVRFYFDAGEQDLVAYWSKVLPWAITPKFKFKFKSNCFEAHLCDDSPQGPNKVVFFELGLLSRVTSLFSNVHVMPGHTGICLTEWPKKRKVSQNHKTHFIPVFIS